MRASRFSPSDARLLDRLTLSGSAMTAPFLASGLRRTRVRGSGLEFHDYRPYQPGDDPRSIDWTVEARLQQLVVRVSRADGHARLHVLVDGSASMGIGSPAKLACAARIAAALCYVAARRRDAAGVSVFDSTVRSYVPPASARTHLFRTLHALESIEPAGETDLDRALEHYAAVARGPGLVAVLSDYFVPGAGIRGLQALLHRDLVPAILQVVAREEIAPGLDDDAEVFDVERPDGPAFAVDGGEVSAYKALLAAQEASLRSFSASHRCPYLRIESAASLEEMLAAAEAAGLLTAVV
jgi:uncharacterized protein (DUF58 family)